MTTFEDARNFLLAHREDYASAMPDSDGRTPSQFNWALDWFDARLATETISRHRPALWIVETILETKSS